MEKGYQTTTKTTNITITAELLSEEIGKVLLPTTIVLSLLICIGILVNCAILCVYLHMKKKTNFVYFVITLTFANIVLVVCVLPVELYKQWNYLVFTEDWLCRGGSIFNICAVFNTAIMVLVIACERFLKICFPIKSLKWISPDRIKKTCISAIIAAFLISIPAGYFFGVVSFTIEYKGNNVTISRCSLDKSAGSAYEFSRVMFVCVLGVTLVPTFIMYGMIVVTVCRRSKPGSDEGSIIVSLKRSQESSTNNSSGSKLRLLALSLKDGGRRNTLLMLVITVLYITAVLIRILAAMNTPKSVNMIKYFLAGQGLGRRFIAKTDVLNSIVQPFIFAILHGQFKAEVKLIWKSILSKRPEENW